VVAQVAGETSALVNSFYMDLEMAFLRGNIVALLADVASAQVDLLLVQLQPVLCFSFVTTVSVCAELVLTIVSGSKVPGKLFFLFKLDLAKFANITLHSVNSCDVRLQIALLCCLIFTKVTRELLSFVNGPHVTGECAVGGGLVAANLALVAQVRMGVHQVVPQR